MARRGSQRSGKADAGPGSSSRRRYSKRGENHAFAHAEAELEAPGDVIDHPLAPAGAAEMITDDGALAEFVRHIRESGAFAYDTEFIGELTYFPQICLVQLATTDRLALVDPLAGVDLTPVWELIADPEVATLVHAGFQDLEPPVRYIGRPPANVFDTQIAAGFAGLPYPVALSKLVAALLGASLGKGLTFTHWDQRPLSEVHQRYAADDVRYLLALRAELTPRLEARGHLKHARGECAVFEKASTFQPDPRTLYQKVRTANDLKPRHLAVLRELVVWRDAAAREHDLPPRTFLKDEMLVRLARTAPTKPKDLADLRGLPRAVVEGDGSRVLEAIAAGKATPAEDRPEPLRIDEKPADRLRIDALWSLLTTFCIARGVDPTLVASRQELAAFFLAQRAGRSLEAMRLAQDWRLELVGQPLLDFIAGDEGWRVTWKRDGPRLDVLPIGGDSPGPPAFE